MSAYRKHPLPIDVRGMVDAAVLLDDHEAILSISPAFEALSGWTEKELIGEPWHRLCTTEGFSRSDERLEPSSLLSDPPTSATQLYRRRDGSSFTGETISLSISADGEPSSGHVLRIVRDRPERNRRVGGLMALLDFVTNRPVAQDHELSMLLNLGCRCFDMELGILCRPAADGDRLWALGGDLAAMAPWSTIVPGEPLLACLGLSSVLSHDETALAIEHVAKSPLRDHPLYEKNGFEALLVCAVGSTEQRYGTLYFADRRPKSRLFDDEDLQVLRYIAHWVALGERVKAERQGHDEANHQLAKSEERYRLLYEKTPAMLHSIDGSGRLANVSDAWLSALGYQRDEVIGRPSTDFLTDESRHHAVEVVLPQFKTTGRCDDVAYQFITKTGDIRDILLSGIAQYDHDGSFLRSLAVLLDVTESKRIEHSLLQKTAALERTNADLARFAHIASHDLREPLRQVIACSEILKTDFGAELSEEASKITGIIQSSGRRLRVMIHDLLAYVRLSEQLDQAFEPVDMSAVLGHALDDLASEIRSKNACIVTAHLPLVWGRAPLFKMVFHHLLANAIKHSGDRSPVIDISVDDAGDVWQFAVRDQGSGVEARFADRIFDIFQQLHSKDVWQGSGAGLAICRLVIQRCGGDIWLDRDYEGGARFVFTLPKDHAGVLDPREHLTLAPPSEIDLR